MNRVYPNVNSAAFIFECSKGSGRIIGYFVEHSPDAGSYRGELLGLMAIHLILKGVNEFHPLLGGSIEIISDCKGALHKVENMPPYQIPTRCSHPDILKNIMLACEGLSFTRKFSHVAAHQDDKTDYNDLSRESQLNCQMDFYAKQALLNHHDPQDGPTKRFPLEPVCIYLGKNKLTSDKGDRIRFWAHRQLAKECFYESKLMFEEFELVDWEMVYAALHNVPRLFQIWAMKQVMNIAPANGNRPWEKDLNPLCPSCMQVDETCERILFCNHAGRTDALQQSIQLIDDWMEETYTDPTLRHCIIQYASNRGAQSMSSITWDTPPRYQQMARSVDEIGWRHFMEGMIPKEIREIQATFGTVSGSMMSATGWTTRLIIKLLEVVHGQWLYRCVQTHDKIRGTLATASKEELQREIEVQMEKGWSELLEEDQYLADVNLEDLENSSGESQRYWLLSVRAALEASKLQRTQPNRGSTIGTTTQRRGHLS